MICLSRISATDSLSLSLPNRCCQELYCFQLEGVKPSPLGDSLSRFLGARVGERHSSGLSRSLCAVSACPGAQHFSLLLPPLWGQTGQGGTPSCTRRAQVRYSLWQRLTSLNRNHMAWAWISLITVTFADVYVRLLAVGAITDPAIRF